MRKNFLRNKSPKVKVAKLQNDSLEKGIVIFIALLLIINFMISMKILFG